MRDLYPRPEENILNGSSHEHRRAAELWAAIRDLPAAEQRNQVRWHFFRTSALFDLLLKESRLEGRKDRQRGIHIVELALHCLRSCADALGERGHDLQALGRAYLGNARRLALDFPGAEADFQRAWEEWDSPRELPDLRVSAEIHFLHGTLRMFQRCYDEALEMMGEALSLSRSEEDRRGQAHALFQRASIYGYMNRLTESTADFREALGVIDEKSDRYLVFSRQKNITINFSEGTGFRLSH